MAAHLPKLAREWDVTTGMTQMKKILTGLALACLSVLAGGAATPADKATNEPFGDWTLHCAEIKPGVTDCVLRQRIVSQETKLPVASFAFGTQEQSKALRLTAILPLGLDIPAGVSGKAGDVPLAFTVQTCVRRGCVASLMVDEKALAGLHGRDAFTATFRMRGVAEAVTLPVSLKGLDEGLKALEAK